MGNSQIFLPGMQLITFLLPIKPNNKAIELIPTIILLFIISWKMLFFLDIKIFFEIFLILLNFLTVSDG